MLLPTKRGTLTTCRGVAPYPSMKKPESTAMVQGHAVQKMGGMLDKPPKIYWAIALDSLRILPL